jgi:hypothetical protein
MKDELNFKTPNNACLSLRVIAERVRTGDAQVLVATEKDSGVLEIKIAWSKPRERR